MGLSAGLYSSIKGQDRGNAQAYRHKVLQSRGNRAGLFIAAAILVVMLAVPVSALTWTTETVDSTGDVGDFTSIALDSAGNPRISYRGTTDDMNSNAKYAAKNNGMWTIETVPCPVDESSGEYRCGAYSSLALNIAGNPRIVNHRVNRYGPDREGHDLDYVAKNNGVWTTEFVERNGSAGGAASIALDRAGNPRISYEYDDEPDPIPHYLKYAAKNNGEWTIEIVESVHVCDEHTSLVLDSAGNPRISYCDLNTGNLKYATKNNGVWTTEIVYNPAGFSAFTPSSLALDNAGNPRIAFYDHGDDHYLKYAAKNNGVWTIETVENIEWDSQYLSLALDSAGNPRISFHVNFDEDLGYAAKNNGVWTTEIVDSGEDGKVGRYCSLALDSAGNPHISYLDATNGDLKYAMGSAGTTTLSVSTPLSAKTTASETPLERTITPETPPALPLNQDPISGLICLIKKLFGGTC